MKEKDNDEENGVSKIKVEENSRNLKEEENENEKNLKYNPLDEQFEDFDVNKLKEIKIFETKYNIEKLIVLQDQGILSYQKFFDKDKKKNLYFLFMI